MLRPASILGVALLLVACGPSSNPPPVSDVAFEGAETTRFVDMEANLLATILDGAQAPTADQVALNLQANVQSRFSPRSCVTSTVDKAAVSIAYAGCRGPRGLTGVTGTVKLTLLANDTTVVAEVSAHALLVNQSSLNIVSSATYVVEPTTGATSLAVQTSGDGADLRPSGGLFDHAGAYELTWTTTCRTLSGNWSWTLGVDHVRTPDVTVANVVSCDQACPASGTVSSFGTPDMFTIDFDGTAKPTYTVTGTNAHGAVPLVGCTPSR